MVGVILMLKKGGSGLIFLGRTETKIILRGQRIWTVLEI